LTQIRGIGEEKAVILLEAAKVLAAENRAAANSGQSAEDKTPAPAAENRAAANSGQSAEDKTPAPAAEDDDDAAEAGAEEKQAEAAAEDDDDAAGTVAEEKQAEAAAEDEIAEPENSPTPGQPSDEPESK